MAVTKAANITRFLTSPGKVAQSLDWRKHSGSILSLSIGKKAINLLVASHPAHHSEFVQPLPSIPIKLAWEGNRKVLDRAVSEELAQLVHDWHVCGTVVNWPVQKEGWCGFPCGRVLNTLDQIAAQSKTVISASRPACLWDYEHHLPPEDEWGRSPHYCITSNKTVHLASVEQYQDHDTAVLEIWKDFCRVHWPELSIKPKQPRSIVKSSSDRHLNRKLTYKDMLSLSLMETPEQAYGEALL